VFVVPPHPVHVAENVVSAVGTTVRLDCQFYGVPPPTISWAKDSYALWPTERVHVYSHLVVIDEANVSDAGLYQCWAESDAGIEYAVIRLVVEPFLTTVLPDIQPSGLLFYHGNYRLMYGAYRII